MKKIIYVKDILGGDIRTRNNAIALRSALSHNDCTEIDMTGVTFVSRSFADELLNVKKEYHIRIANAEGEVSSMLAIVEKGRNTKSRPRTSNNNSVVEITSMEELERYFATI